MIIIDEDGHDDGNNNNNNNNNGSNNTCDITVEERTNEKSTILAHHLPESPHLPTAAVKLPYLIVLY